MKDASEYTVEFFQIPLFNTWSYHITLPNGRKVGPPLGMFADPENAEKAALAHVRRLVSAYSLTGAELEEKHGRQSASSAS